MQKIFICIYLMEFLLSGSFYSFAQTDLHEQKKHFQLAFVPQYLINKGVRIDFDYILKNSKHVLSFSPQIYYDKNEINYSNFPGNYYENEYEHLNGFGVGIHHKIRINSNTKQWVFYFTYGVEYAHFSIKNKRWEWLNYTENNLEYLKYELIDIEQNTDRFRIDTYMNFQYNYAGNLFLDFYIGLGGVYSLNSMTPDYSTTEFDSNMYDYAFNGMYLPIGFRFGFRF